jgi:hypothetical protein
LPSVGGRSSFVITPEEGIERYGLRVYKSDLEADQGKTFELFWQNEGDEMSTLDMSVVMKDSDTFGFASENPDKKLDLSFYSN